LHKQLECKHCCTWFVCFFANMDNAKFSILVIMYIAMLQIIAKLIGLDFGWLHVDRLIVQRCWVASCHTCYVIGLIMHEVVCAIDIIYYNVIQWPWCGEMKEAIFEFEKWYILFFFHGSFDCVRLVFQNPNCFSKIIATTSKVAI
jgi:hypothetical protein